MTNFFKNNFYFHLDPECNAKKRITILFWGPLGKQSKTTIGGGEPGNRRTIDMISNNGIKVIEIPKPYPPKHKIFPPPFKEIQV